MSTSLDANIDHSKMEHYKKTNESLRIYDDLSIAKNKNLVIVYCPPKVGSTTLVTSIRMSATGLFTVLHIHNEIMLKVLCNIENVTIGEIINYNRFIGKNVYVIDIYRSPIEQKMSLFFEDLCSYHYNNTAENINTYNVAKITSRFNSLFPYLSNDDYYRNQYNIPILPAFDFKNKYLIQNINGIKYIKLRLKDVSEWSTILKGILGIDIKLVTDYETENKPINKMYKKLKDTYKIPSNLLKTIETNEMLKYYYTDHEKVDYLNMWRQNQCTEVASFTQSEFQFYNKISSENKYMNEIQTNHYIDLGCNCVTCSFKRVELTDKINKGIKLNKDDKVIHGQLINKPHTPNPNLISHPNMAMNKMRQMRQMRQMTQNYILNQQKLALLRGAVANGPKRINLLANNFR